MLLVWTRCSDAFGSPIVKGRLRAAKTILYLAISGSSKNLDKRCSSKLPEAHGSAAAMLEEFGFLKKTCRSGPDDAKKVQPSLAEAGLRRLIWKIA